MKLENKFFFFMLAMVLFSFPLFAEEGAGVSDVVNAYVYHADRPDTLQPIYAGDTLPADGVIYLPNANSSVTFTVNGQNVVLQTPGFFNSSGAPIAVSNEIRAAVAQALKSQAGGAPFQAENLTKTAKSDLLALQVDDPQNATNAASPSI
jgi:hypothetical protein